MWHEDGPFDWDAELAETIEHELEHHMAYLVGDDPMDEEERDGDRERGARASLGKKARGRARKACGVCGRRARVLASAPGSCGCVAFDRESR